MNYERKISSLQHERHTFWVDVNDVMMVDGREFCRNSYGYGPDLGKITEQACNQADEAHWCCQEGAPGIICVCGSTEFSLSYGSYECLAHCKCGRTLSVYSG